MLASKVIGLFGITEYSALTLLKIVLFPHSNHASASGKVSRVIGPNCSCTGWPAWLSCTATVCCAFCACRGRQHARLLCAVHSVHVVGGSMHSCCMLCIIGMLWEAACTAAVCCALCACRGRRHAQLLCAVPSVHVMRGRHGYACTGDELLQWSCSDAEGLMLVDVIFD